MSSDASLAFASVFLSRDRIMALLKVLRAISIYLNGCYIKEVTYTVARPARVKAKIHIGIRSHLCAFCVTLLSAHEHEICTSEYLEHLQSLRSLAGHPRISSVPGPRIPISIPAHR